VARQAMAATSRTKRGEATRRRLLEAAEVTFGRLPYHDASIVKITEAAGVAQGTFYLYFGGKQQIFEEVVDDLNHRIRRAMAAASQCAVTRREAEHLGFGAFFNFIAENPALYRVIRQAEFVAPGSLRRHYERLAQGYAKGLAAAMATGEVTSSDPEVLAWSLMGVGELVGMRWVLWDGAEMPPEVVAQCLAIVDRALGIDTGSTATGERPAGSPEA
jgi:AcrR family transcriptional regulator